MAANVTKFTCARCLQNGTVDNTGTYLKVFLTYTAGTSVSYRVSYGKDSDTTLTLVRSGTGTSFNGSFVSSTAILQADFAYTIAILITGDGIFMQRANVPKSFVLIDINASGKGLAIGKISERSNELEFGMTVFDRYNTRISNGLAYYLSGGAIDANTTTEELVLTTTNTPISGIFYFIRTIFYLSKSATANRTQIAYPYANSSSGVMTGQWRSNYRRHYVNGIGWSQWIEEPVLISSGKGSIWTYKGYSDGTAEAYARIRISGISVNAALGNWFRSEALWGPQVYAQPFTFIEVPTINMDFQTTNGNGGMLWFFSSSEANALQFIPQCYIIRPTTATNVNGYVHIAIHGKI